jgi:acyl-[acyl-carrier-protein]-phospholipid O-acyltransferase/long-chain-fatty-acid--[acyl-carrier-protein] ligase
MLFKNRPGFAPGNRLLIRPLLLSRRFAPLFWCQFFAAFNDNFLKTSLVFLILFGADVTQAEAGALITLASAIFIAPFFFLSGLGGELADRYDKARVARWLKFIEIGGAAIAVFGYARQSSPILFVALLGFGMIAALFGPMKYGILPDHLEAARLPAANALIEGATFIAILSGTIVGGLAAHQAGARVFGVLVMGFAFACFLSALRIPPSGEGAPHLRLTRNIAVSTAAMIRHLRAGPRLWWGALVTSWFWLVGIIMLSLLPPLVKTLIGGDERTVTAYLALFSIGIGIGSALAALIARGRIVLKTTVAGAVLLAGFALDLGIATLGAPAAAGTLGPHEALSSTLGLRAGIDLAGMAIAGGLFIVPAFAAVQAWSDADYRARTVAAVNVLNAAFMTGGTVLVALLQKFGVTTPVLFLGVGVATAAVAAAIRKTMPDATVAPASSTVVPASSAVIAREGG